VSHRCRTLASTWVSAALILIALPLGVLELGVLALGAQAAAGRGLRGGLAGGLVGPLQFDHHEVAEAVAGEDVDEPLRPGLVRQRVIRLDQGEAGFEERERLGQLVADDVLVGHGLLPHGTGLRRLLRLLRWLARQRCPPASGPGSPGVGLLATLESM